VDLAMLLVPDPVSVELETAPGWSVDPVQPFDPAGVEPVAPSAGEEPVENVLLAHDQRPRWVVARQGDTVIEVHELDGDRRVTRSLFLEPRTDGAVEILYRRDADGAVLATERRDRTGAVL
jgi:hypothetical protein